MRVKTTKIKNSETYRKLICNRSLGEGIIQKNGVRRGCTPPADTIFLGSYPLQVGELNGYGKEKRHEKLVEKLGDNYYCLQCREVEKLLSVDVLKKVVAEYERVEVSELKFKDKLTEENYRDISLGQFIDENLLNKKRKGSYASESGTVSDKVNFCKKAVQHIEKLEDLSEEARELCRKIYEFIKGNNL